MKLHRLMFLFVLFHFQQTLAADIGIYVANSGSADVSVIDPSSNTVTATVNVGTTPQGIAALPDGSAVYVANNGSDNVSVIDTSNNTVTTTINVGDGPFGVAVAPDGSEVYVTNQNADTVSVITVSSNTVSDTINVGDDPRGIVVNPAGTFAYVVNTVGESISVIDLSNNTVTATITLAVGSAPRYLAVNNAGTKVYVTGFLTNKVYEITTASNTVTNNVNIGNEPLGLVVSSDDATLYALNALDNTVSKITTSTLTVASTLTATSFPREAVLSTDEATLYSAEQLGDVVSIINVTANTKATVAVGTTPFGIAFARTAPASSVTVTQTTNSTDIDPDTNDQVFTSGDTIEHRISVTNTGNGTYGTATLTLSLDGSNEVETYSETTTLLETDSTYTTTLSTITCDAITYPPEGATGDDFTVTCPLGTASSDQTRYFVYSLTPSGFKVASVSYSLSATADYNGVDSSSSSLSIEINEISADSCDCNMSKRRPPVGQIMADLLIALPFLGLFLARFFVKESKV